MKYDNFDVILRRLRGGCLQRREADVKCGTTQGSSALQRHCRFVIVGNATRLVSNTRMRARPYSSSSSLLTSLPFFLLPHRAHNLTRHCTRIFPMQSRLNWMTYLVIPTLGILPYLYSQHLLC